MNIYEQKMLNVNSLEEFHKVASNLPTTNDKKDLSKRKGDFFELFTKLYLKVKWQTLYSDVWLRQEIPNKDLKTLNMKRHDKGIDLLAIDYNGKIYGIQSN